MKPVIEKITKPIQHPQECKVCGVRTHAAAMDHELRGFVCLACLEPLIIAQGTLAEARMNHPDANLCEANP